MRCIRSTVTHGKRLSANFGLHAFLEIHTGDALLISLGEEHECLGITLWRLQKSLTVRILANAFQNRANSARNLFDPCCALFFCVLSAFSGTDTYRSMK